MKLTNMNLQTIPMNSVLPREQEALRNLQERALKLLIQERAKLIKVSKNKGVGLSSENLKEKEKDMKYEFDKKIETYQKQLFQKEVISWNDYS